MVENREAGRLKLRGTRLGILSGGSAGALAGFTAVLYWGLWSLLPKLIRGENLGASDPVTPAAAVANTIFNAVFFGAIAGVIFGAALGAIAGYFVRREDADAPRAGWRLGASVFTLIGLVLRPHVLFDIILFVVISAAIGAFAGRLGDRIFARLFQRGVAAHLSNDTQEI